MPMLGTEAHELLAQAARAARLDEIIERARQASEMPLDARALDDAPRA